MAAEMDSMTKKQSFKLLDAYYEAGGNFIDTIIMGKARNRPANGWKTVV